MSIVVYKDNSLTTYICRHCKSVLGVPDKDVFEDVEEYGGGLYTTRYFYCPCCGFKYFLD